MTLRSAFAALTRPIDAELAADLEKQAAWVSPRVRELHVGSDGRTIRFVIDGDGEIAEEQAKVRRFIDDMVQRHRALPRKVIAHRSTARPVARDAFGELARRGWVVELARGRASLRGPALEAVRALDEDCARIARRCGAVEEAHPALASTTLLARCGWFSSFPQAASLVGHLAEDYDALDRFRRDNADAGDLVQPVGGTMAPFDACLLPALCYAVYAARESTALPREGIAITCAGRCYRYESRNLLGIERLWDFGMREVVFLGTCEAVAQARSRALDAVVDQLERWDLCGAVETANDPFFPAGRADRAYWQRSRDRKYELRLPVASDEHGAPRSVACASFNLHDRFFGSAFAITLSDGAPAASACVGWGMERWMLACFAQHGFDPKGWPSWLRHRVFR